MNNLVTTDCETHPIAPAQAAPRLVVVAISWEEGNAEVIHRKDPAARREVLRMLESDALTIGGHNLPYDLACWCAAWPELLPLVFKVLDDGRVLDVQHRQKLIDIALGEYRGTRDSETGDWVKYRYDLKDVAARHGYPVALDKDTWRLRWGEFEDVPVSAIPADALEYARHDVLAPRHIIPLQESAADFLIDQHRRTAGAFGLQLTSVWGLRTDPKMVARYKKRIQDLLDSHRDLLLERGFIEYKKDGTLKKNVNKMQEYGEATLAKPVRTPTGRIKFDEDSVQKYTEDPVFQAFQEFGAGGTAMNRVAEWEQGTVLPIHTHFDELMESGRTSSSNPNVQARYAGNNPSEPKFGDRECVVPREGNVFLIADVPGLELSTIAQKCITIIGYSRLADDLNAGNDPHSRVAARILGIPYEEVIRRKEDPNDEEVYLARQTGKIMNFGRDAMAGADTIVLQARTKYGVIMTREEAKRGIQAHGEAYPEVIEFHKWIYSLCGQGGYATITHLFSDRVRGWVRPTEASNTFSQGLGADATIQALYELQRSCYIGTGPLRGTIREDYRRGEDYSRLANYVHDEYIVETVEVNLDAKANEMGDVLTNTINEWLPDVPIKRAKMQPYATRRWSKLARRETVDGKLVAWEWEGAK